MEQTSIWSAFPVSELCSHSFFLSLFLYPEAEGLLSFRAYFPSVAASVSCTTAYRQMHEILPSSPDIGKGGRGVRTEWHPRRDSLPPPISGTK